MWRIILTSVLAASAFRSSVEVGEHDFDVKSHTTWGASCESLQARFHTRVLAFQTALEANPDEGAMSRTTQARLSMRVYGVVRTLRRARECDWVINSDSPDIEALQTIVQRLQAGNPCAAQANVALQEGADDELSTLWSSMSILMSDTCEAADFSADEQQGDGDENIEAALERETSDGESQLQDNIEELIASEEDGAAFIQSDAGTVRGFFRALGVAFGFILLLLLCTSAAMMIAFILPMLLFIVAAAVFPPLAPSCGRCFFGPVLGRAFLLGLGGGALGGIVGLVQCARSVHSLLIAN